MGDIMSYLQTEFATFEEKPFNPVDSLILSQFCMVRMEGIAPAFKEQSALNEIQRALGEVQITLESLAAKLSRTLAPSRGIHFTDALRAEHFSTMFVGLVPDKVKNLTFALAASPRFRQVTISECASVFDEDQVTQFSALTFTYKDQFAYVGFQGTDSSFTGWREDFNMAYLHQIPAQAQALKYLESVANRTPDTLYVGGHSKGGNLAAYAAAKASDQVKERIAQVFSHDGPGLREGIIAPAERTWLNGALHKTVPQDSLIGMLLESSDNFHVIESRAKGIDQHDPFSWVVEGDNFEYLNQLTPQAAYASQIISSWLARYDERQTKTLVDALFDCMEATGAESFSELISGSPKTLSYLKNATANADEEDKEVIIDALQTLSKVALKTVLGRE
ncbi:MAG: Mbeg1-like protein [Eggerthellaceae bacterium]